MFLLRKHCTWVVQTKKSAYLFWRAISHLIENILQYFFIKNIFHYYSDTSFYDIPWPKKMFYQKLEIWSIEQLIWKFSMRKLTSQPVVSDFKFTNFSRNIAMTCDFSFETEVYKVCKKISIAITSHLIYFVWRYMYKHL